MSTRPLRRRCGEIGASQLVASAEQRSRSAMDVHLQCRAAECSGSNERELALPT